jgi:hypothetical protein
MASMILCLLFIVGCGGGDTSSEGSTNNDPDLEIIGSGNFRGLASPDPLYFPDSQIIALRDNDIVSFDDSKNIDILASFNMPGNTPTKIEVHENSFLFSYGGAFPRGVGLIDQDSSVSIIASGGFDGISGIRKAPSSFGLYGGEFFLSEQGNGDVIYADGGAVDGIVKLNIDGNKSQFYDGVASAMKCYQASDIAFSPSSFGDYGDILFVVDNNISYPDLNNHRIMMMGPDASASEFFDLAAIGNATNISCMDFNPLRSELFIADSTTIYKIDPDGNTSIVETGFSRIIDIRFNENGDLFICDSEDQLIYRLRLNSSSTGDSEIFISNSNWNVTGRYSTCGASGTAEGIIQFQSSGSLITGYVYTGEEWHHDCTVTNIGTVQDDLSYKGIADPLSISEVGSLCDGLVPGFDFDVTVTEFSDTRFTCSIYDSFDGSIEIVTFTK